MRLCATAKPAESGDSMKIERHDPSAGLKPPVKTLMTVESHGGAVNGVLPGTSTVMAFRLKGAAAALLFGAVLATAATLHARVGGAIQ